MRRRVLGFVVCAALFATGGIVGAVAYREGWHKAIRGRLGLPQEPRTPHAPGWPNFTRAPAAVSGDLDAQLRALGYLTGYEAGSAASGAHTTADAQPGSTLYTSGHAPEARLMDLSGRLKHRWYFVDSELKPGLAQWWRRARVLPNGDLFAIADYSALYKLDRNSKLLWRFDGRCHHDLDVTADGRVWVLTRESLRHPIFPGREVYDDSIAILAPDGTLLRKISILDAFANSDFAPFVQRGSEPVDILHTNTVRVLDGRLARRIPAFRAGNVLVSLRAADTVAVIDVETERVVWAIAGPWKAQHDPTIVGSGRLMVFDNRGRNGKSRVLEIDPTTQEVAWLYPRSVESSLFAVAMGAAQRLSGGNTLIVESTRGHAIEVSADGRIVWEFWNPERAGENGELIATLPHMERLPADFPQAWTTPPADAPSSPSAH
jgi:hypothetical protein